MRTRVPGALLRARALALAPRLPRSSQAAFATSTAKQRDPRTRPSDNDDTDLGRHFYLNKVLEQWAARHATRMTLRQLVFFGKTLGRERDKILKVSLVDVVEVGRSHWAGLRRRVLGRRECMVSLYLAICASLLSRAPCRNHRAAIRCARGFLITSETHIFIPLRLLTQIYQSANYVSCLLQS